MPINKGNSPNKKQAKETDSHKSEVSDDIYLKGQETIIITPPDQVQLTEKEKQEHIKKCISCQDPNIAHNKVFYSYTDKQYMIEEESETMNNIAVHFDLDSGLHFVNSEEAFDQLQRDRIREDEIEAEKEAIRKEHEGDEEWHEEEEDLSMTKNSFNYCDRAAQTYSNPLRERGISTTPPPIDVFQSCVSKWEIYDAYLSDYELEMANSNSNSNSGNNNNVNKKNKKEDQGSDVLHCNAMGKTLKMLERIVNHNREDEIYEDATFWDDGSDEYRNGEGSLLPLWCFTSDKTKKRHVTALEFHPTFPDMFCIGFGSYEFSQNIGGLIYVYSFKNTSYPQYTFSTNSGITSINFHPQHHSLLCVGCRDGNVHVFDIRSKQDKPIFSSSIKTGKHTDPVWEVCWQIEDIAKDLNFFSISSDGYVCNWIMKNSELKMEIIMKLKLSDNDIGIDGSLISGFAGGICFDFNKVNEHLFIVGTEEGKIHKCSKAYSGQYLESYEGHHMAVYSVKWNYYHPEIFISCSADWSVKIWDHRLKECIMSFDLGDCVGDVDWSPYSSTVFGAVTNDGRVLIYDLSSNKHDPICEQRIVKKCKLTHISFNKRDAIIIVGDDHGKVMSFKLSPNLRRLYPYKESESKKEIEINRLDKILQGALDAMK